MEAILAFDDEPDETTGAVAAPTTSHAEDAPTQKLGLWQGTALLTADCLGVGILALPESVHALGWVRGLSFLILQLPINYYAGFLLANTACEVEREWQQKHCAESNTNSQRREKDRDQGDPGEMEMTTTPKRQSNVDSAMMDSLNDDNSTSSLRQRGRGIETGNNSQQNALESRQDEEDENIDGDGGEKDGLFVDSSDANRRRDVSDVEPPTEDLIGITTVVFDQHQIDDVLSGNKDSTNTSRPTTARNIVMLLYYLNIFLVLGDYILVMSHAVAAIWPMCITTAGLVASLLMFAICQLNTMTLLGKYVSIASLLAMLIVLGQCIYEIQVNKNQPSNDKEDSSNKSDGAPLLRQFSALASICFAVGSQKLFLNVRYELEDRATQAAPVLARSLTIFGVAYIAVVMMSGSDPPSFLFDAIPENTLNRRVAGLLLWGHVAVSYAINSQALCSSMDRLLFMATASSSTTARDRIRWISLTFVLAVSSYLVANAIPFFKDLVALIGAATTVPLNLTLPPVIYQHWQQWTRLKQLQRREESQQEESTIPSSSTPINRRRSWSSMASSSLLLYSVVFLGVGLAGSLASVKRDWANASSGPFACGLD